MLAFRGRDRDLQRGEVAAVDAMEIRQRRGVRTFAVVVVRGGLLVEGRHGPTILIPCRAADNKKAALADGFWNHDRVDYMFE